MLFSLYPSYSKQLIAATFDSCIFRMSTLTQVQTYAVYKGYRHSRVLLDRSRRFSVPKIASSGGEDDVWVSWSDNPHIPEVPASNNFDWREELKSFAAGRQDTDSDNGAFDPNAPERAFLVGVQLKGSAKRHEHSLSASLEELGRLAETAGLEVVGSTYQSLESPNPRTYIGTGKIVELCAAVASTGAETVIFDDELTPSQLRNLERALGGGEVRLCDRTALVLDVFSQRAATREGQLQVALAQVEYQIPRLTRMWSHLERQSGSGQVKGMGEKQIEVDRRLLRNRAARLRKEIEEVRTHRKAYRERRASTPIPVIALVGYTNAGKSSLLNALTDAGVLAEDKLFATLDPTTRRLDLPAGQEALITDTVGFIQKLPTELIAAFRATLEEISEATLLLHVVDASSEAAAAQVDAVNKVLDEVIGPAKDIPTLTVWNKVDACADPDMVAAVAEAREGTIPVSALCGTGIPSLLHAISKKLQEQMVEITCLIPYSRGDLLEECHRCGSVLETEYSENGTLLRAKVPLSIASRVRDLRSSAVAASSV